MEEKQRIVNNVSSPMAGKQHMYAESLCWKNNSSHADEFAITLSEMG